MGDAEARAFFIGAFVGFMLMLVVLIIIMGESSKRYDLRTCDHYLWDHAGEAADSLYYLKKFPECEGYTISEHLTG